MHPSFSWAERFFVLVWSLAFGIRKPSPLGDRDAAIWVCKMRSPAVTRSGTASITSCGSRSTGFLYWAEILGQRARELLREIARAHDRVIYAGAINRNHVHMLIGIPPHMSVSRAAQ